MTAISRSAAQQLAARTAAEKARTEAKKQPGPLNRETTKRVTDSFKGASASAGLEGSLKGSDVVGAKLSAHLAPARAELASAGAMMSAGAAMVSVPLPTVAKAAEQVADAAKKLASDPSKAFGPFSVDLGSLVKGARELVKTVSDVVQTADSIVNKGLDLITRGAELVTKVAGGLDSAKELAIDELRKNTIDGPIDNLNSEGDTVKINLGGELLVPTPIPDLKAKGTADVSAEIKREKDGGYTISTEANVALGASVGVEDPSGNEASGDLMLGGGGKMEFKIDPVLNDDGSVNEVATKEKVKELTEAIARTAAAGGAGPIGSQIANQVIGPTAAQQELMQASFKGVELKGQAALALAAKLNLPGMATLEASGKVSEEFTLRIEKGDKGMAVSVKQTLAGEAEIQGGLSPGVPGLQGTAGVKGQAKVELEQKFEFPGTKNVGDIVKGNGTAPPVVTNTLTLSTDVQGGVGGTLGGESGVADGTLKENRRVGVTTEVKITAPNDPAVLRKVVAETLKGNLADAARTAGDHTEVELKTTVYTERQRTMNGTLKNETVGGVGAKGEVVERDVIRPPKTVKTTASNVVDTVRGELDEMNRLRREVQRSPIMLRA